MSIKLNYKNHEYTVSAIFWDRDSFFVDFKGYWLRLLGLLAQKVAENTTNNWNSFTQIRTRVITSFGLNVETEKIELSSPVNYLPVNTYPPILLSSLSDLLRDKARDELISLFQILTEKALNESSLYLKNSIILKNTEIIKKINKSAKQFLITNDSKENNELFIKEANLENYFYKVLHEANKEQLDEHLKDNSFFLTSCNFLKQSYLRKKIDNVLLVENINLISFNLNMDNNIIKAHIDGASKGNPGPAGIGIVFYENGEIIEEIEEFIGNQTNNFAEYTALIKALEICTNKNYKNVEISTDSELVAKQINKVYKVKDAYIKDLYDKACSFLEKLEKVKVKYVPREENLRADKLANNAIKKQEAGSMKQEK